MTSAERRPTPSSFASPLNSIEHQPSSSESRFQTRKPFRSIIATKSSPSQVESAYSVLPSFKLVAVAGPSVQVDPHYQSQTKPPPAAAPIAQIEDQDSTEAITAERMWSAEAGSKVAVRNMPTLDWSSTDDAYGGFDDDTSHYSLSTLPSPGPFSTLSSEALRPFPDDSPLSPLRPPNQPFLSESNRSSLASSSSSSLSPSNSGIPESRGTWRSDVSGTSTNMDAFAFRAYESTGATPPPKVVITSPTTPRKDMGLREAQKQAYDRNDSIQETPLLRKASLPAVSASKQNFQVGMTPSSSGGKTRSLYRAANFSRPLRAGSPSSEHRSSYERSESALSSYSNDSSGQSDHIRSLSLASSNQERTSFAPLVPKRSADRPRPSSQTFSPPTASSSRLPSSPPPRTSPPDMPRPQRRPSNPIRLRPPRTPPSIPPPAPPSWSSFEQPRPPPQPYASPLAQQRSNHQEHSRPPALPGPERPPVGRFGSDPSQTTSTGQLQQKPALQRTYTSPAQQNRDQAADTSPTRTQIMQQVKSRPPPPAPVTPAAPPRPGPSHMIHGSSNLSTAPLQDRYSYYDPELIARSPATRSTSQQDQRTPPSPIPPGTGTSPVGGTRNAPKSPAEGGSIGFRSRSRAAGTPEPGLLTPEPRTAEDYLQLGITHHQNDKLVESAWCFEVSAKGVGVLRAMSRASDRTASSRYTDRPSGDSGGGGRSTGEHGELGEGEAAGGCAVGMLMWGLTLRSGWGVKKDETKGFKWLRRAAEFAVEDLEAMRTKGLTAGDGRLTAMQSELVLAIYEVGQCFFHGWGVPKDKKMGKSYFQVAARMGDCDAQQELGFCYFNGAGTKKDKKEAAKWYRRAAEQGASTVGLAWIYKDKYM